MTNKAVIFDRDGTLIVDKGYLNDPKGIDYLDGVFSALQLLKKHSYIFVIATNQSGVPRGLVTLENLESIHQQISQDFAKKGIVFVDFYVAPYLPESNHPLRKPNPGMLLQASKDHNIDLSQSWMVGDKLSDVEAGHNAGCKSALITSQNTELDGSDRADFVSDKLLKIAQHIVSN